MGYTYEVGNKKEDFFTGAEITENAKYFDNMNRALNHYRRYRGNYLVRIDAQGNRETFDFIREKFIKG